MNWLERLYAAGLALALLAVLVFVSWGLGYHAGTREADAACYCGRFK